MSTPFRHDRPVNATRLMRTKKKWMSEKPRTQDSIYQTSAAVCVSSSRALDDDRDCTFKISYLTSFLLPILEVAEEHTQTSRVVMLVKLPQPGDKTQLSGTHRLSPGTKFIRRHDCYANYCAFRASIHLSDETSGLTCDP